MTQKEKIRQAVMSLMHVKIIAQDLKREAEDYDMKFHRSYVKRIVEQCDECLKILK